MLPQMMPLPWIIVFLFLFFCFYSIFLYLSMISFSNKYSSCLLKSSSISMVW
uniref:ATP synthase subunit 8 n=1 Tax=Histiostoma feroniarum TaxID=334618 RepID=A0A2Z4MAG0_9ACAR|nr:ATP synthase F0 subunit 8 [Histiostoma feroniarum]AWX53520.1 ATP synthase subunit 8 [Histiostoma feroniarum]